MLPEVRVTIDGTKVLVPVGTSVAAAIALAAPANGTFRADLPLFRRSVTKQEPRSAICGMGICHECRVTIDGVSQMRSCLTRCVPGMVVETVRSRPRGVLVPGVALSLAPLLAPLLSGPPPVHPVTGRVSDSPSDSRSEPHPRLHPAPVPRSELHPRPGAVHVHAPAPVPVPEFADVLVMGAGPAGLAVAARAGRDGRRVVLVDENSQAGGQIWRGEADGTRLPAQATHLFETSAVDYRPSAGDAGRRRGVQYGDETGGDRPDRRDRADHPDRRDRADHPDRRDRADHPDRVDRADHPDRVDSADRPDRADRADRADRPDRRDGADHPDRVEMADGARGTVVLFRHGALHEVRFRDLVLATGARELFLPFPGWTLPNVFGAGGLQALVKSGWPIAGKRVVVAGSGPLLLAVAALLRQRGAEIVMILEQTALRSLLGFARELLSRPDKWGQVLGLRAALAGVPYRAGHWVVAAEGRGQVERVVVTDGSSRWREPCDAVAIGYGLVPSSEFARLIGCDTDGRGAVLVDSRQATSVAGVHATGEVAGIGGLDLSLSGGGILGAILAGEDEESAAFRRLVAARKRAERFAGALARAFALRPELRALAKSDTVVCRCEDVSLGALATFPAWRDAKLHSRCGMGACQGRVCGAALREIRGWQPEVPRPPISPVPVSAWAPDSATTDVPCGAAPLGVH